VSVLLAFAGLGVWSLVWGQIAGGLVSTLLYWWVARWRPRLSFDREIVGALLGYGSQIVLVQILGMIHKNIDYLIIGRRMSADELGFYFMAFRIPDLVIVSLCSVLSQALFPAYARLQADPEGLRRGFLATLRYTSLITVPLGIGTAFVASDFVTLFYTSRWAPSIAVMQMLALYALFQSLSFNAGDVYKATGRPAILNYLGVVKLVVTIPVLWIAAGSGIYWVAVGQAATALLLTLLSLEVALRVLGARWLEVARTLRPAAVSATVMAMVLVAVARLLPPTPALRMSAMVLVGSVAYAATLWWTDRAAVESALALLPRRRS
jgi:PST family polysaccharide transporter